MPRPGFGTLHMAVRARRSAAAEAAPAEAKQRSARSIVICTNPRSGSWLLSAGLGATTLAGNPREWFNPFQQQRWRARWRAHFQSDMTIAQYLQVIRKISKSPNGISGIKLHAYQLRYLQRSRRLDAEAALVSQAQLLKTLFPNPHYIWLRRRDRARQAISLELAFATNKWWSIGTHPGHDAPDDAAPAFDPVAIALWEAALKTYDAKWSAYFRLHAIVPTTLFYEDLIADYEGSIRSILRLLDVPEAETAAIPPARLRQQSDARSEDWLVQYQSYRATADAGALHFPSIHAEDPIEARCRNSRSVIPPIWRTWIAHGRRQGLSADALAAVLVSNDYDAAAARAAVEQATADTDAKIQPKVQHS